MTRLVASFKSACSQLFFKEIVLSERKWSGVRVKCLIQLFAAGMDVFMTNLGLILLRLST